MGSGESVYVQNQERFVRDNLENYKKNLPSHYGNSQIKGKLRQLYANTDTKYENKRSYIMDDEWNKAKQKTTTKYISNKEMRGDRYY
jgi:hypothetical protein